MGNRVTALTQVVTGSEQREASGDAVSRFGLDTGSQGSSLTSHCSRFPSPFQMESACVTIHEALKTVIDSQTHYRLREAQDRARAEDLSTRVSCWSVGEVIALLVVSFSQVLLLKAFFTEKRTSPQALHS
ncbi:transmembrane emp24 domain-containing protein 3 isoform X1 [Leptonychotes weddellii]|uniref:Transmembrane emp24 domain-containing protein 3 isoform X1 n=1 Tax=Leptonychotes weddellii TaxID=9713 RepID=A0A7F8PYL7_LEPWE|nr:transmembrane emp24 domain-containing protein 3 isoform X1 [Leptonychotes weddellii]